MIDETTTLSTKSALIIFIRIQVDDQVCNFFYDLVEMSDGSSGAVIAKVVLRCFSDLGEEILHPRFRVMQGRAGSTTALWVSISASLMTIVWRCPSLHRLWTSVSEWRQLPNWHQILEMTGTVCWSSANTVTYCEMSWRALYESDEAEHVRFVHSYVLPKSSCKDGSKLALFRQYCLKRQSSTAMLQSTGEQMMNWRLLLTVSWWCRPTDIFELWFMQWWILFDILCKLIAAWTVCCCYCTTSLLYFYNLFSYSAIQCTACHTNAKSAAI